MLPLAADDQTLTSLVSSPLLLFSAIGSRSESQD
jgi:hypothetical protein